LAVLELQKAAKKCLTTITFFRKIETVVFLAEDYGINRIYSQKCVPGGRLWKLIMESTEFSAKFVKTG
jgi:hypothetical protein